MTASQPPQSFEVIDARAAGSTLPCKGRVARAIARAGWGERTMLPRKPMESFRREMARGLRANPTDAEARLWRQLRRIPMFGSHFRRQVPIGPYIADYACMAARLIIEIDGSQHGDEPIKSHDEVRTRWLEK